MKTRKQYKEEKREAVLKGVLKELTLFAIVIPVLIIVVFMQNGHDLRDIVQILFGL